MKPEIFAIIIILGCLILIIVYLVESGIIYRCKHDYKLEKTFEFHTHKYPTKTCSVLLLYKCTKCSKFKKVWVKPKVHLHQLYG